MTAWERTNRPKPGEIHSSNYDLDYMVEHRTCIVWRSRIIHWWYVEGPDLGVGFPTFAEAIQYAQKTQQKGTRNE